jgi:hypothetical protein
MFTLIEETGYQINEEWLLMGKDWLIKKPVRCKKNKDGKYYLQYTLYYDWKEHKYLAHRLVAQAFLWLDIKDKKTYVCHKDDNPENNKVENLFLWTAKQNTQDAVSKKRMKRKLTDLDRRRIKHMFDKWLSNRAIGKIFDVSNVAIWKIRKVS